MFFLTVSIFISIACGVLANPQGSRQSTDLVTQTVTETTTEFVTTTSSFSSLCAWYVNASEACRRRLNDWIDPPILLAFDDDLDLDLDVYLRPSRAVSIEVTNPVELSTPPQAPPIESSGLNALSNSYDTRVGQPIYFSQLAAFFSNVFGLSSTTTITTTSTRTVSFIVNVTTSTKTVIISGCIPADLPLSTC